MTFALWSLDQRESDRISRTRAGEVDRDVGAGYDLRLDGPAVIRSCDDEVRTPLDESREDLHLGRPDRDGTGGACSDLVGRAAESEMYSVAADGHLAAGSSRAHDFEAAVPPLDGFGGSHDDRSFITDGAEPTRERLPCGERGRTRRIRDDRRG